MNKTNTMEKTLNALLVNLYTKESIELTLPLSDDELHSKLIKFNPNENECEIDYVDVILSENNQLTPQHKALLQGLSNCTIENINKVAAILQESTDFAFLFCACDSSFEYANTAYTRKSYTIFKNVPDDETFGEVYAEHIGLFNSITNPKHRETIKLNFDYHAYSEALFNNEVMKDATRDVVVHFHKNS